MWNLFPSILFGLSLVLFASWLCRLQWVYLRSVLQDPQADEGTLREAQRRWKRRRNASLLMVAIGLLIPVGDAILTARPDPLHFVIFATGIMLLTIGLVWTALLDLVSIRLYAGRQQRQLEFTRRTLERQLVEERQLQEERLKAAQSGQETSWPYSPN